VRRARYALRIGTTFAAAFAHLRVSGTKRRHGRRACTTARLASEAPASPTRTRRGRQREHAAPLPSSPPPRGSRRRGTIAGGSPRRERSMPGAVANTRREKTTHY